MWEISGLLQFDQNLDNNRVKYVAEKMNKSNMSVESCSEKLYFDKRSFLQLNFLHTLNTKETPRLYWNESQNKVIAFTGKIYNRKALCNELFSNNYICKEIDDAQIILHGMELHGSDFLIKVEGTFLFVIYDTENKEFTLARDCVGNIPLYYYNDNGVFLFSSTLKNLLYSSVIPAEIDKEALSQFLQLTYIPAPKAIIKNVNKMLPATIMKIDINGDIKSNTYWNISIDTEALKTADYDVCKRKLRNILIESVEKRMEKESSVGAFLSGGFDSTIVVGIMSMLSKTPINTFTVGFNDKTFDERNLANIVSEKNKTNHKEIILDLDNVFSDIDEILNNMDEPYADSSLIATYSVSKAAKEYVSVVLTGDAGDELFAGYNKYLVSYYSRLYNKIPDFIKKGFIKPFVNLMPSESSLRRKAGKLIDASEKDIFSQRKQLMCLGFKENELKQLMSDEFVDPMDFIKIHYNTLKDADEQMKAQYIDFKTVLEGDMLPKVYKASLISGIDSRAPLLDTNVIELAYRMPSEFKINRTKRKIILKDAFSDLIPKELYNAPKHGFAVPIAYWLEHDLKDRLYKYASPDFLKEQGLFDADYIAKIIEEHMSHTKNRYSELWAFYVFQDWYVKLFDITV